MSAAERHQAAGQGEGDSKPGRVTQYPGGHRQPKFGSAQAFETAEEPDGSTVQRKARLGKRRTDGLPAAINPPEAEPRA